MLFLYYFTAYASLKLPSRHWILLEQWSKWRYLGICLIFQCFNVCVCVTQADKFRMGKEYIVDELVSCLKRVPLPPDIALTEYRALLPLEMDEIVSHICT